MHLLHNQTYVVPAYPEKTNWVFTGSSNSNFVTSSTPGVVPKVGTYMMKQPSGASGLATYGQYTNSLAGYWNQYTIEGWVNTQVAASQQANRMSIGPESGGNSIALQIVPNFNPNFTLYTFYVYYNNGANVWQTNLYQQNGTNAWVYLTLVKQSNSSRFLMVNGVTVWADNSTTFSESPATTGGNPALTFGRTNGAFSPMVQTIWDQWRISDIARYDQSQTFTPPTTAFVNDINTWYLSSFENTWTPAPSPT